MKSILLSTAKKQKLCLIYLRQNTNINQRTTVSQGVEKEEVQAKFSSNKVAHNQTIKYLPRKAFLKKKLEEMSFLWGH